MKQYIVLSEIILVVFFMIMDSDYQPTYLNLAAIHRKNQTRNASYVVLFPSIISIKLIISSAIIKFHRLQIKIKSDKIQFVEWIQQAENQMS